MQFSIFFGPNLVYYHIYKNAPISVWCACIEFGHRTFFFFFFFFTHNLDIIFTWYYVQGSRLKKKFFPDFLKEMIFRLKKVRIFSGQTKSRISSAARGAWTHSQVLSAPRQNVLKNIFSLLVNVDLFICFPSYFPNVA